MSHILFAVKRSELLELDTTMTHLSTWIFTSILISMWNKGSSTSFQPPHFFPTCLKHNSRKLGKKKQQKSEKPTPILPSEFDTLRLGMDLDLLDPALLQVSKVTSNSIVDP